MGMATDTRRAKACEAIQKQGTIWSAVATDRCIEAIRHDGDEHYERLKREAKEYLARDAACTELSRTAVTIINGMWPHAILQRAEELAEAAKLLVSRSPNTAEADNLQKTIDAFDHELRKEQGRGHDAPI